MVKVISILIYPHKSFKITIPESHIYAAGFDGAVLLVRLYLLRDRSASIDQHEKANAAFKTIRISLS